MMLAPDLGGPDAKNPFIYIKSHHFRSQLEGVNGTKNFLTDRLNGANNDSNIIFRYSNIFSDIGYKFG